jgi:hypothetical protein
MTIANLLPKTVVAQLVFEIVGEGVEFRKFERLPMPISVRKLEDEHTPFLPNLAKS